MSIWQKKNALFFSLSSESTLFKVRISEDNAKGKPKKHMIRLNHIDVAQSKKKQTLLKENETSNFPFDAAIMLYWHKSTIRPFPM